MQIRMFQWVRVQNRMFQWVRVFEHAECLARTDKRAIK